MNDQKVIVCLLAAALLGAAADLQPGPSLDTWEDLPAWRVSLETSLGGETILSLDLSAGRSHGSRPHLRGRNLEATDGGCRSIERFMYAKK